MSTPITYRHQQEGTVTSTMGEPGESLLDAAQRAGVPIPANCGGQGACGACHVIITGGMNSLSPPEEEEEDALDPVEGLTENSRLACQAVILPPTTGGQGSPVQVEIPERSKGRPGVIE